MTGTEIVERVAQALVRHALGTFEAPLRDVWRRPLNPPFTPNSACRDAARAAVLATLDAIPGAVSDAMQQEGLNAWADFKVFAPGKVMRAMIAALRREIADP